MNNRLDANVSFDLLGAPTGNCQRAAVAMEEAGVEYRSKLVDLRAGEHKSLDYLKVHPAGKVPVLIEQVDGRQTLVLSQSNAIMLHVADVGPNKLLPALGTRERATAYERYMYVVTDVIAQSHAGFFMRSMEQRPQAAMLRQRSIEALSLAEHYLGQTPYLAGDIFTLADIAAITIVMYESPNIDWGARPHLRRWFEEVRERPSVVRGMAIFKGQG